MNIRKRNLTHQISVVIITRNRLKDLTRTLQQLQALPAKFPIIVVDNNSTDGTANALHEQFPQVTVVSLSKNMGALGRNIGVQQAKTPYIAFCDDDSWWADDALTKAVHYFKSYPQVGLIAGRILVKDQQKLDPTSALQSISPLEPQVEMPGPAILGFLGCGIMVRKDAFEQVGGYNKHIYFSGEEELLGIDLAAAGWGLTYCDDIIGHHYPSTVRQMPQRYRMGARNVIQAAWMRRPLGSAIAKTADIAKQGLTNPDKAIGLLQGIARLPLALKNRHVIPDWLEEQIQTLEDQNAILSRRATLKQRQHAQAQTLAAKLTS